MSSFDLVATLVQLQTAGPGVSAFITCFNFHYHDIRRLMATHEIPS